MNKTYRTVDASSRLSIWQGLVPAPYEVGLDFWIGVATQAMVVAMHDQHHCPADSIYVQKKPATKVIVKAIEKFVLTPYPCRINKVGKEVPPIHLTIGTNPPVTLVLDRPSDPPSLTLEFWRARRTSEKDHSNMVIKMTDVECRLPTVPGLPQSVVVRIPTAVTSKKLRKGDELVLHIPGKP